MIFDLHHVHVAQSALLANHEPGVGGCGGIDLALHQRGEVEQAGHDDGDIGLAQAGLVEQYLQVLTRAAGQAVDADALAFEVGGLADVG